MTDSHSPNLLEQSLRHKPHLRADAAWALMQILEHGVSSRDVMPLIFKRQAKVSDRAWLQETVFGVLRVLPTLQTWLRLLLKTPLKNQQKIIEHVIMLGLFQQAFMRTSSYAAVSETVNAAKILNQPKLSGLVNAILRNFVRENIAEKTTTQDHVKANLPKWLYRKLITAYPTQIEDLCYQMQQKPPLWLRVNPLVMNINDYSEKLSAEQIGHEIYLPYAIRLEKYMDVTALPLFDDGGVSVQDLAAQHAARLLNVQPGETVLDACAAPGGKTAAIIESCPDIANLYAVDSVASRNTRTHENLQRLGHTCRMGDKLHILNADASCSTSFVDLPTFDKILLDAPCSATGVIRRHPDIKWHRKPDDIETLVATQSRILETTWDKLKPGGTLLYATCSILPEENQEQIRRFLLAHSEAELLTIENANTDEAMGWQIMPGVQNMDGFFYARLLKSA